MRRAALLALALATPAAAQTAPPASAVDHVHGAPDDIVVTAPFRLNRVDLLSSVSVLSGTELQRDLRANIGETLARQPGVSSTAFGPAASRPILRGLQGERVRVLTDGIGSFDVSNTSVDHAVAINPLLAERIEVLRGPASLLYGSSAIGGVVNVVDRRIPRAVPDEIAHIDALGGYGSAAEEWFGGTSLDVPVAGKLVLHADGSYRTSDDLGIGGPILRRALREQAAANGLPELAALRGRLPNSDNEFKDYAGGLAFIDDTGSLGVAVSRLENDYGIPVRYSVDPEGEAEEVGLAIEQTRVDARGELRPGGFFERLQVRFGYADYEHAEIERETGEIGTRFFNDAVEARLELTQAKRGVWRGVYGAQVANRIFDVEGDEAFVPRNTTDQAGLFTLHEFDLGDLRAEVGGRYERTVIKSNDSTFPGGETAFRGEYDAWSGSAGASYRLGGDWRIGLNATRSERAPAAEELLANGPHAGTQAFEIGDPGFRTETSWGVEGTLRGGGPGFAMSASVYYTDFSDYIELTPTGEVEDDLPVFQFIQSDAEYYGVEGELSVVLVDGAGFRLSADALGDYTHARIKDFGPAPRIPPFRVRGGLEGRGAGFTLRGEVEHVGEQDRVAAFETETDAYTLFNASIAWRPFGDASPTTLLVEAANLADVSARRHSSFLKDFAPLAGRDIRATARFSF